MKTTKQHILTSMILAGGLLAVGPVSRVSAGEADHTNNKDSKHEKSADLRMTRADTLLGRDVMSSDHQKVGDIDDFVLDLNDGGGVTHALVTTGGFLNIGGETRAVPIDAISQHAGVFSIDVDQETFNGTQVLGDDRAAMLNDRQAMNDLRTTYGLEQRDHRNNSRDAAKEARFLTYSDLKRDDVLEKNGDRIGIVTDAWIDTTEGEVPYIEVLATRQAGSIGVVATVGSEIRYNIPASSYERTASMDRHVFDITREDLYEAPSVSEADFVRSGSSNRGGVVLRVDESEARNTSEASE